MNYAFETAVKAFELAPEQSIMIGKALKVLAEKAGISIATITKMGKNGHVTTEVLLKICTALGCGVDDIMEIVPDSINTNC